MKIRSAAVALVVAHVLAFASPSLLRAEEIIEQTGVAVGVTAGNLLFLPIKAIVVGWSALAGGISYVVTGGNADLTRQIWRDTREPPYVITPELARTAIGERPETQRDP